ncbi:MAG: hypothetical protein CVU39_05680 [Chloroflexi bacterium HGW-Chloroflexi-10]|nr:MAG: hypothetical protein CVU39_05680 [Chloroflexi bacterium HGW-Chloroflexi-10]
MYQVKIDGKEIEVSEGTTVLNAARQAGIEIPTLCDHPALEPYGGCRLCLVEVEGARTLQPACTLPVTNNMVIHTDTSKVSSARKFVLSMIFSERNHFCPYCQVSGGDCELQNAAYDEEMTHWPLQPNWQVFEVDASHPYFVLDHNRCILCRRCVRACGELVGNFTLGMEERGSKTLLMADLGVPLGSSSCISCGTCVQICPTGALIDRWSAYRGQQTDTEKTQSICVSCSLSCGIEVISRNNSLLRVDGNWDANRNGGVICEIGRFRPMDEKRQRLLTPLVRKDGVLKAATWDEAFKIISQKFQPLLGIKDNGVAAIASTRLPAEALHAFKQIFNGKLGSNMVTSTEEGIFTAVSAEIGREKPGFEGNYTDLKSADTFMLIGADLTKSHQVAGFIMKRAIPAGAKLITVGQEAGGIGAFTPYAMEITKGSEMSFVAALKAAVAGIDCQAMAQKTGLEVVEYEKLASVLKAAQKAVIVYGTDYESKQKTEITKSLIDLAAAINGKVVSIKGKANGLFASLLGLDQSFKINGHQAAFVALGDEELTQSLAKKLEDVPFLVMQTSYHSASTAKADVVLPTTIWSEQEGHYLSFDGVTQKANKALQSPVDVKTNLEVLEAIAARLKLSLSSDWQTVLKSTTSPVEIA